MTALLQITRCQGGCRSRSKPESFHASILECRDSRLRPQPPPLASLRPVGEPRACWYGRSSPWIRHTDSGSDSGKSSCHYIPRSSDSLTPYSGRNLSGLGHGLSGRPHENPTTNPTTCARTGQTTSDRIQRKQAKFEHFQIASDSLRSRHSDYGSEGFRFNS